MMTTQDYEAMAWTIKANQVRTNEAFIALYSATLDRIAPGWKHLTGLHRGKAATKATELLKRHCLDREYGGDADADDNLSPQQFYDAVAHARKTLIG